MIYNSTSVKKTIKIAADLARQIVSRKNETLRQIRPLRQAQGRQARGKATVVALEGELGAGKTTFAKSFAKSLGIKDKLTSPTFVIMRKFTVQDPRFKNLYHVDAYRLNSGQELRALGIEEIFSDPKNIVLIEWAERVADILPEKIIKVHMDHTGETARKISITF